MFNYTQTNIKTARLYTHSLDFSCCHVVRDCCYLLTFTGHSNKKSKEL